MPSNRKQYGVLQKDAAENNFIKEQARIAGLSVSNWFRAKAGLPALEVGTNFKINNPAKLPLRAVTPRKRASARQQKP